MGRYNPRAPIVLGEEWVPIRDEALVYSPNVNSIERGVTYSQPTDQRVRDARFYVNKMQATPQSSQVGLVNVYPYGLEDLTGPIQQVIIPVRSGASTGTGISVIGSAANFQEAVYQPGDSNYVEWAYAGGLISNNHVGFFFAVNDYPVLANKRILNVSLLYAGSVFDRDANGKNIDYINPNPSIPTTSVALSDGIGTTFIYSSPTSGFSNTGAFSELATTVNNASNSPLAVQSIAAMDLGDINNWWSLAAPTSTDDRMPWRYVDLQRYEPTAANRLFVDVRVQLDTSAGSPTMPLLWLDYLAMRVIYCEERRIAYGAKVFNYSFGKNSITLRDQNFVTDPILPAGDYVPTLSWVSVGQRGFGQSVNGDFPTLNADRQLYEIPSHPAVDVAVPFPLADRLGEAFTRTPSMILPQLSLHASGGTLTDPHVYGRQAWAQVWGTNTATQPIYDDLSGVNASYPQVRFYARRFGDTTVPLRLTGTGVFAGNTVTIDAATFDALPEIVTGVREVTLRFTPAPIMGAATGSPAWTFSAPSELAGNRWEVLAASAPAISGVGGSLYTLVPSPNQLGSATYTPPVGSTVALTWMPQGVASPWVTGASLDAATDAVLIFSQDPNTITGVGITQQTQAVSGVGALCGGIPCCIPTGIGYNRVTWSALPGASLVQDSFSRTVVSGMGNPDVGTGPWVGNDIPAAYAVDGSQATITPAVTNGQTFATLDVGSPDVDIVAQGGSVNVLAANQTARIGLVGRYTDANNLYAGFIQQNPTTGQMITGFLKIVGGSATIPFTENLPLSFDGGGRVWMRLVVYGSGGVGAWIKFKAWRGARADEPALWSFETNDTSLTTGNRAGLYALSGLAGANVYGFDNVQINQPSYWFGAYELQRWDAVTGGDFQTIMRASDIWLSGFNDYEARVGASSVYRIRALNALNFAGAWSSYVSGAPPAPGVTGGCSDMTGALVFTSNADQTGLRNAAYIMQWDGTPAETFEFPEAEQVQYQPMYARDGSIAFHGTERGLEKFTRAILLAAGAIALPSLGDATTIRDLAWQQLPYVCVRDSRGNRWFASVRLPTANARNDAQNYVGQIAVVETTRTPFPVDP